jgi:hypothetical protein
MDRISSSVRPPRPRLVAPVRRRSRNRRSSWRSVASRTLAKPCCRALSFHDRRVTRRRRSGSRPGACPQARPAARQARALSPTDRPGRRARRLRLPQPIAHPSSPLQAEVRRPPGRCAGHQSRGAARATPADPERGMPRVWSTPRRALPGGPRPPASRGRFLKRGRSGAAPLRRRGFPHPGVAHRPARPPLGPDPPLPLLRPPRGRGRTGLRPGDAAPTLPGVRRWHGAAPGRLCADLAMSVTATGERAPRGSSTSPDANHATAPAPVVWSGRLLRWLGPPRCRRARRRCTTASAFFARWWSTSWARRRWRSPAARRSVASRRMATVRTGRQAASRTAEETRWHRRTGPSGRRCRFSTSWTGPSPEARRRNPSRSVSRSSGRTKPEKGRPST